MAASISVGGGGAHALTYTAANGSTVSVAVDGGTATIAIPPGAVAYDKGHGTISSGAPSSIALTDTGRARVALTFTAVGGTGGFALPAISGTEVAAIVARRGEIVGNLSASSLGRLVVGGVGGDGLITVAGEVGSVAVAGAFAGTITAGQIGTISADAFNGAMVDAAGDIGRLTAETLSGTTVAAGVAHPAGGLPTSATAFAAGATIGSISTLETLASDIIAARVGRLSLGHVGDYDSAGTPNTPGSGGVAAETISSLSGAVPAQTMMFLVYSGWARFAIGGAHLRSTAEVLAAMARIPSPFTDWTDAYGDPELDGFAVRLIAG